MVLKWLRRLVRGKGKKGAKSTEKNRSEKSSAGVDDTSKTTPPTPDVRKTVIEKQNTESTTGSLPTIINELRVDPPPLKKNVKFLPQMVSSPSHGKNKIDPSSKAVLTPLKSCLKRHEPEPAIRGILKSSGNDLNLTSDSFDQDHSSRAYSRDDDDFFDESSDLRGKIEHGAVQGSVLQMQLQQQKLHENRHLAARQNRYHDDQFLGDGVAVSNFHPQGSAPHRHHYMGPAGNGHYPSHAPLRGHDWNGKTEYPFADAQGVHAPHPSADASMRYYDHPVNDVGPHQMQLQDDYSRYSPLREPHSGASSLPAQGRSPAADNLYEAQLSKGHCRKDSREMHWNSLRKRSDVAVDRRQQVDGVNSFENDVEGSFTLPDKPDVDSVVGDSKADSPHQKSSSFESSIVEDGAAPSISRDSSKEHSLLYGADLARHQVNPLRKLSSESLNNDAEIGMKGGHVASGKCVNPEDTSSDAATGDLDAVDQNCPNSVESAGISMHSQAYDADHDDRVRGDAVAVDSESAEYGAVQSSSYEEEFTSSEDFVEMERLVSEGFSWNQANDMVSLQRRLRREEEENERLRREAYRQGPSSGRKGQHFFQSQVPRPTSIIQHGQYYHPYQAPEFGYPANEERPGAYHATGPLEDKYFKTKQRHYQVAVPAAVVPAAAATGSIDFASQSGSGRHHRPSRGVRGQVDYSAGHLSERGMVPSAGMVYPGPPMHTHSDAVEPRYSEHKKASLKPYHSEYALKEATIAHEPTFASSSLAPHPSFASSATRESYGGSGGDHYFAGPALPVPHSQYPPYPAATSAGPALLYPQYGAKKHKKSSRNSHHEMRSHPRAYSGTYHANYGQQN